MRKSEFFWLKFKMSCGLPQQVLPPELLGLDACATNPFNYTCSVFGKYLKGFYSSVSPLKWCLFVTLSFLILCSWFGFPMPFSWIKHFSPPLRHKCSYGPLFSNVWGLPFLPSVPYALICQPQQPSC